MLIVTTVTSNIPLARIDVSARRLPNGIYLADPTFHNPGKIDMLLGVELFFELLQPGHIKLDENYPKLRETRLGWVVTGAFRDKSVIEEAQN